LVWRENANKQRIEQHRRREEIATQTVAAKVEPAVIQEEVAQQLLLHTYKKEWGKHTRMVALIMEPTLEEDFKFHQHLVLRIVRLVLPRIVSSRATCSTIITVDGGRGYVAHLHRYKTYQFFAFYEKCRPSKVLACFPFNAN
jgi:hypothetical protein